MRIVLGLWLLQAVSAGSAWLALSSASRGQVVLGIGLTLAIGLVAAMWFWSALRDQRRLGEAQQSERTANGAAAVHAKLAQQRADDAARLHALTRKVAETRSRLLKAGFLTGGALGLCLALVLTQFFAIGLAVAAFAGGGAAGYVLRGWLNRRAVPGSGASISTVAASASPAQASGWGRGSLSLAASVTPLAAQGLPPRRRQTPKECQISRC
jgi:hypothetical protein